MKGKYFWIKERNNPQLGTYYVAMGQITVAEARGYESHSLYGSNIMHKFVARADYEKEIARLESTGAKVQKVAGS